MPIETGRWVHLFAGNYLLYGPLGLVFHALLQGLGFHHLAVISLQAMDALLGAAGVFVFYLTLRRLGGDTASCVIWSIVLGCSLGYWLWSTEAEDYILSTFLLLTNFHYLVRSMRQDRVDPVILGALHGLAILGHIVNVIFGAVVLWFLYIKFGQGWFKPARRYAGAAAVVVLGAYGTVIAFIQKPASLRGALNWFEGSAALGQGAMNWGGGFTLAKLGQWAAMSLRILGPFPLNNYYTPHPWACAPLFLFAAWSLFACFFLVLVTHGRAVYRKDPAVVGGCAIWLLIYALMFTRWEPWTMVYRVSDLVPLCVLLFLGCREVADHHGAWRGAAAALACCLAIGNLGAEIYPRSFASNNSNLERMAFLKANTVEGDWITGDGGQDEIYIPYFAQRRPIVVQRYTRQPGLLVGLIDALQAHKQSVYVTSRVLSSGPWKAFFKRYQLAVKATGPRGFVLYRVGKEKI